MAFKIIKYNLFCFSGIFIYKLTVFRVFHYNPPSFSAVEYSLKLLTQLNTPDRLKKKKGKKQLEFSAFKDIITVEMINIKIVYNLYSDSIFECTE